MAKGKAISDDLCWAIVRMAPVLEIEDISAYTAVSARKIYRILALHRATGNVCRIRDPRFRGRKRQLSSDDAAFLQGCINKSCDKYLDELRQDLEDTCGVSASLASVWRSLHRSGYTMKKLTRVAIERNADKRAEFIHRIGLRYAAEQLVAVDESSCDRRTSYRGKAWAIQGRRAVRKAFFVRGRRFSVLPALSCDGILYVSIVEGSFNHTTFSEFISGLLDQMNPYPGPNSVILMDNCRIHKNEAVLEMIVNRGMRYEFLPPYSPDFNPIELAFSAIKAYLRRNGEYMRAAAIEDNKAEILARLHAAVWSVSSDDAKSWFDHCGYV